MKFKVGDKVMITGPEYDIVGNLKRESSNPELCWTHEMDILVGDVVEIVEAADNDYTVEGLESYGFSDEWLEKVE